MEEDIRELYEELLSLCKNEGCSLQDYRTLRESFERVIRERMCAVGLQATDLAARINYLSSSVGLDGKMRNALHTFRLTSNDVLNHRKEPVKEEFLRDGRWCSVSNGPSQSQYISAKQFEEITAKKSELYFGSNISAVVEWIDTNPNAERRTIYHFTGVEQETAVYYDYN